MPPWPHGAKGIWRDNGCELHVLRGHGLHDDGWSGGCRGGRTEQPSLQDPPARRRPFADTVAMRFAKTRKRLGFTACRRAQRTVFLPRIPTPQTSCSESSQRRARAGMARLQAPHPASGSRGRRPSMACSVHAAPSCPARKPTRAGSARRRRRESARTPASQSRLACSFDPLLRRRHEVPPHMPRRIQRLATEQHRLERVFARQHGEAPRSSRTRCLAGGRSRRAGLAPQHVERAFRRLGIDRQFGIGGRSSAALEGYRRTPTGDSIPKRARPPPRCGAGMPAFRKEWPGWWWKDGGLSGCAAAPPRSAFAQRTVGTGSAGGSESRMPRSAVIQFTSPGRMSGRLPRVSRWANASALQVGHHGQPGELGARRCRGRVEQRRPHVVDDHERPSKPRACRRARRRTPKPPPRSGARAHQLGHGRASIRNAVKHRASHSQCHLRTDQADQARSGRQADAGEIIEPVLAWAKDQQVAVVADQSGTRPTAPQCGAHHVPASVVVQHLRQRDRDRPSSAGWQRIGHHLRAARRR